MSPLSRLRTQRTGSHQVACPELAAWVPALQVPSQCCHYGVGLPCRRNPPTIHETPRTCLGRSPSRTLGCCWADGGYSDAPRSRSVHEEMPGDGSEPVSPVWGRWPRVALMAGPN